jgi:hypothetical protein
MVENGAIPYLIALVLMALGFSIYKLVTSVSNFKEKRANKASMKKLNEEMEDLERAQRASEMHGRLAEHMKNHYRSRSNKLSHYAGMYGSGQHREPIEHTLRSINDGDYAIASGAGGYGGVGIASFGEDTGTSGRHMPHRLRGIAKDDDRMITYHFEQFNRCRPRIGDIFKTSDRQVYTYCADKGRGKWLPTSDMKAMPSQREHPFSSIEDEFLCNFDVKEEEKEEEKFTPPTECKSIW